MREDDNVAGPNHMTTWVQHFAKQRLMREDDNVAGTNSPFGKDFGAGLLIPMRRPAPKSFPNGELVPATLSSSLISLCFAKCCTQVVMWLGPATLSSSLM